MHGTGERVAAGHVTARGSGLALVDKLHKVVRVVRLEISADEAETLRVRGHLVPVALDVLEGRVEVGARGVVDLAVHRRVHDRLGLGKNVKALLGALEAKLVAALDGAHERVDAVRVALEEVVVGDVEDRAEAAAAEIGEFVDAQHVGAALAELLQLNLLVVDKAHAAVDGPVADGLREVHSDADGRVVALAHALARADFVNYDLAKLADVTHAAALDVVKALDAALLGKDNARRRLVEERSDGRDVETARLGGNRVHHGLESHVDLAAANNLRHIAGVRRLENGHFDALSLKVAVLLRDKDGRMVWVG
eukprot:Opistho-1_new@52095